MSSYGISATHFASKINLKEVKLEFETNPIQHNTTELIYRIDYLKYVFIYNFGSVVFFNIEKNHQHEYLQMITAYLNREPVAITSDDFIVREDPNLEQNHLVTFNSIQLKNITFEQLSLICINVGASTTIEFFEKAVENMLEKSIEISRQLRNTGKARFNKKEIIQYIGQCLTTKQEITSDLYIYDEPDITWEDQNLSRLFNDVKRLVEIEGRYKTIEYKLQLIQDSVEITIDLLQYESQHLLELVVVVLISAEVFWLLIERLPGLIKF